MSHQNIKSNLLVELSTEEQQLLSGGNKPGKKHKPIICYEWRYRHDKKVKSESDENESESDDD
jgi:hypothetical protein